jgi:DNA-binding HxlR family transcriptional regulator
LDLVGDKWSLVIIRDLLTGKQRFNEFADSPENIPTNLLASRLKQLEEQGLLTKQPHQSRPVRYAYRLTRAGEDLLPVLQAICRWARANIEDCRTPPKSFVAERR